MSDPYATMCDGVAARESCRHVPGTVARRRRSPVFGGEASDCVCEHEGMALVVLAVVMFLTGAGLIVWWLTGSSDRTGAAVAEQERPEGVIQRCRDLDLSRSSTSPMSAI